MLRPKLRPPNFQKRICRTIPGLISGVACTPHISFATAVRGVAPVERDPRAVLRRRSSAGRRVVRSSPLHRVSRASVAPVSCLACGAAGVRRSGWWGPCSPRTQLLPRHRRMRACARAQCCRHVLNHSPGGLHALSCPAVGVGLFAHGLGQGAGRSALFGDAERLTLERAKGGRELASAASVTPATSGGRF